MSVSYTLSDKEKGGQSEILMRWKVSGIQERAKSGIWIKNEKDWLDFVTGKKNNPYSGKKKDAAMKRVEQEHTEKKTELSKLVDFIELRSCDSKITTKKGWVKDSIDLYYQRGLHKKINLLTFVESYVAELPRKRKPNGKPYAVKTIADYRVFNVRLVEFVKEMKIDVEFAEIDTKFTDSFNSYLTSKGYCYNTIGKYMKTLKTVLLAAKDKGLMANNVKIKTMSEEVFDVALKESELEKIASLDFTSSNLSKCRDYFLILCYTGVRISDLETVLNTPIVDNQVTFIQKKTAKKVVVPLLDEIRNLFEQYANQKVDINSNFNDYIRKICKKACIDEIQTVSKTIGGKFQTEKHQKWELVSTHTGRRSFATNSYYRNIPSLTIMSVTGHRTESAFLKYIKVDANEHAKKFYKNWNEKKGI